VAVADPLHERQGALADRGHDRDLLVLGLSGGVDRDLDDAVLLKGKCGRVK
jgi:hypothetical protein